LLEKPRGGGGNARYCKIWVNSTLITRWGTCALANIGFGTRGGCWI
jgi:hypothetical protein